MNAVELRPLGIGEILDVAIKIYFRYFGTFLRIALFIVLPTQLIVNAITASASDTTDANSRFGIHIQKNVDGTATTHISAGALGAALVALLLTFLASQLATGACFKAVADGYLGTVPDWRGSVRVALRRLGSMLWIAFLVGLVGVLGLLACLVPGVWFLVGATVAVPVLFTEDERGWSAIRRSRNLVKGRWWPTAGLLLIGAILGGVIGGALTALVSGVGLAAGDNWAARFAVGVLTGTATAVLTTPFAAAYQTILYVDLRVRKEGFDLALFAHRLGAAPPPTAAPAWGFAPTEPAGGAPAPAQDAPIQPEVPESTWEPGSGTSPLRPPGEPPPSP